MRAAAFGSVLLVSLTARTLLACSLAMPSPDDVIENPKYRSANGAYVVVVREHPPLGDFQTARHGDVYPAEPEADLPAEVWEAFADNDQSFPFLDRDDQAKPVEIVVYHVADGVAREIGRLQVDRVGELLVANDGSFFIEPPSDPCGYAITGDDEVRVFTPAGSTASFTLRHLLSPNDLAWLPESKLAWAIDDEMPGRIEIRLTPWPNGRRTRVAKIDSFTGARLDGLRDLLPPIYAVDVELTVNHRAAGPGASRFPPLVFPPLAVKARVSGIVIVDFSADADGKVTATTVVKGLPFGLDKAAVAAVERWIVPEDLRRGAETTGTVSLRFRLFPDEE